MSDPGMLQVVLMGLITVFVGLICLIIIIVILGKIMKAVTGNQLPPRRYRQPPLPLPPPRRLRPSPAISSWWRPLRRPSQRTWGRTWTTSRSCPSAACKYRNTRFSIFLREES